MLNNKVLVIVGPTGSGKTGVAIEIAKELDGEIISADSRAIYKGMDIGTAKPTIEEQQEVKHWGIDLVEPGERFTVADWKRYAEEKIEDILRREKVPIVVGGTGLYIDALIFDYQFNESVQKSCSDRTEVDERFLVVGVDCESKKLRERIEQRIDTMFRKELFRETKKIASRCSWDSQAMKSNIYQFAWEYMCGNKTMNEAKRLAAFDDWHLAKRQITWFKRNKKIIWLPLEKIKPYVLKYMKDE